MMQIAPVTLKGRLVRLVPLETDHIPALAEVGLDPEVQRWSTFPLQTAEEMAAYVRTALDWQAAGTAVPFTTIERATGRVVGTTRFANIDRTNRRAEIGWTFVGKPWQRTGINREAKYLMFRHGFETWQCIRVELKTDSLNQQSRNAMLKLGAKEEGTLRNHMVTATERLRHTVYFSVTREEWPAVKSGLEARLTGG